MPRRRASHPSADTIRLVVVEPRPLLGVGVSEVLNREPDMEVVAEVRSADEALQAIEVAETAAPDVILIDAPLAGAADVEATRRLRRGAPDSAMVVLGGDEDAGTLSAIEVGAVAHVTDVAQPADLVDTIRRVVNGEDPLKDQLAARPELVERVVDSIREEVLAEPAPPNPLTPREVEILELVAAGLGNRPIGEQLSVSEQTVKNHLGSIFQKCGTPNRRSAVEVAGRHGWLVLARGTDRSPDAETA